MSTGKTKDNGKGAQSAFDRMIESLMQEQSEERLLDDCMSNDIKAISRIPLRYRLIALGFVRKYSLQEVNDLLKSQGCAALYSRSLWEASLIYAFHNGLSYTEWKELQKVCREVREQKELRETYLREFRAGMEAQLQALVIRHPDGTEERLQKKQ